MLNSRGGATGKAAMAMAIPLLGALWPLMALELFCTVKNLKFQKSKMVSAAILQNLKIAISRP